MMSYFSLMNTGVELLESQIATGTGGNLAIRKGGKL
jgi:hypothetical protein